MTATVTYLKAYVNNFGPQQSYHAFVDTLIRICEEMDVELDQLLTRLGDDVAAPDWEEQICHARIETYRKMLIMRQDTFDFLHETMMYQNEMLNRHS